MEGLYPMKAIVCTETQGHYTEYLRYLIEYGDGFTFLGPYAVWSQAEMGFDSDSKKIRFIDLNISSRVSVREIVRTVQRLVPCVSEIIFMGGERLRLGVWAQRVFHPIPMRAVLYETGFFHARADSISARFMWFERILKIYLMGVLHGIEYHAHDTAFQRSYNRYKWVPGCRPLRSLNDPMPDFQQPPILDGTGSYLLLIGYHGPRKGTVWALDALESAGVSAEVVVAGDAVPGYFDTLRPSDFEQLRVHWLPGAVSEARFDSLVRGARVVLLPYLNWGGSSGVLLHAIRCGKPVILPEYGQMNEIFQHYGWGKKYPAGSVSGFVDAVRLWLQESPPAPELKSELWAPLMAYADPKSFTHRLLQGAP